MPTRRFCDLCDAHINDDDWYGNTTLTVVPSDGNRYPIKDVLIERDYVNPESTGTVPMVCQKCVKHILALFITLKTRQLHNPS